MGFSRPFPLPDGLGYLHRFQSLAEAHRIIGEFIARYNTEWLIERLGHQTPVAARTAAMAA